MNDLETLLPAALEHLTHHASRATPQRPGGSGAARSAPAPGYGRIPRNPVTLIIPERAWALAPIFAQMLRLKYGCVYPLFIVVAVLGAYTVSNNMFSVWIVLIFALIGYPMKRVRLPMAPLVLGLVIGPLFEKARAQTTAMGGGDPMVFFGRPIAVGIFIFTLALIIIPIVLRHRKGRHLTRDIESEL